jgi:hypothetical protein
VSSAPVCACFVSIHWHWHGANDLQAYHKQGTPSVCLTDPPGLAHHLLSHWWVDHHYTTALHSSALSACARPTLFAALQFEIATTFGAFLDPVADKVMVTTVLVLLSTEPPAPITQVGAHAAPLCCSPAMQQPILPCECYKWKGRLVRLVIFVWVRSCFAQ